MFFQYQPINTCRETSTEGEYLRPKLKSLDSNPDYYNGIGDMNNEIFK